MTYLKYGTRVRIANIVDPGPKNQDADLNGLLGEISPKNSNIPFGDIGVQLYETRYQPALWINVKYGEYEVV